MGRVENIVGKGENAGYRFTKLSRLNPSQKKQTFDSSKMKDFADDNFKFDENDRKFSKLVENTVGKGEISHYEQFLLFPQHFQKTCTAYT